jgi:hypothetical protein
VLIQDAAKSTSLESVKRVNMSIAECVTDRRWQDALSVFDNDQTSDKLDVEQRRRKSLLELWLGKTSEYQSTVKGLASPELLKDPKSMFAVATALRVSNESLPELGIALNAALNARNTDPKQYGDSSAPGALLLRLGRLKEAEVELRKLPKTNELGPAYLGLLLRKKGENVEANMLLKVAQDWMAANPNAAWDTRMELAILLREAGIHVEP